MFDKVLERPDLFGLGFASGIVDTLLIRAILDPRMSGMRVITIPVLMAALVAEYALLNTVK